MDGEKKKRKKKNKKTDHECIPFHPWFHPGIPCSLLISTKVMGISLQGQRMVIALGVQDFVDRKAGSAGQPHSLKTAEKRLTG